MESKRLLVCLLSFLFLVNLTGAQPDTKIDTKLFLEEDTVNNSEYRNYIGKINTFLDQRGIHGRLEVSDINRYENNETSCLDAARFDENNYR